MTRAFGDRDLKSYITAEPDVSSRPLSPDAEFVVLATDGLWDFVGNQVRAPCLCKTDKET